MLFSAVPRKITSGLRDLTSREGFQARFEVTVSHEDVSGTWLKDGIALTVMAEYCVSVILYLDVSGFNSGREEGIS